MACKLACVQMGALGTRADNVDRAVALVGETDANIIILPELFAHCRDFKVGEPIPGPTSEIFAQLAREKNSYIVMGSVLERAEDGQMYNTSVLIDTRGAIRARYRKIHLFSYRSKEKRSLTSGTDVVVASTELGAIGLSICYDLRFPELYRSLVLKGAQILVCPAAWPSSRLAHWNALSKARAIENQCYFVGCNQVGTPVPTMTLGGGSMITDPWGEIMVAAGDAEAVITATIDVAAVNKIRKECAFLDDIVPV